MPPHRSLFALAALGAVLLGCEREPVVVVPDVVGRWMQEDGAGREWVEFYPGGAAVVHARAEDTGADETVQLQWYWTGPVLVLRGNGGLSQRIAVAGDRMVMEDGTALVRQRSAP